MKTKAVEKEINGTAAGSRRIAGGEIANFSDCGWRNGYQRETPVQLRSSPAAFGFRRLEGDKKETKMEIGNSSWKKGIFGGKIFRRAFMVVADAMLLDPYVAMGVEKQVKTDVDTLHATFEDRKI